MTLFVTDSHGASTACSARVIVLDTTPPSLTCPSSPVVEFLNETGATVSVTVSATDTCSEVTTSMTPPSGSWFAIGVTRAQAQAVDASGNRNQCAFTVTVLGAQGVKSNVLAELTALRARANPGQPFAQKFHDAIQHLADSLNPAYWIDQTHLQPKGGNTAMNEEKLAVIKLGEIMDSKQCPVAPARLQGFIERIVKCDRLLAVISIREAAKAGLNPKKAAQDLATVAQGDREAAAGHYAQAIEHYRNAWRHALQLQLQIGLNPDGTTRVRFVGDDGKSYGIEVSADMVKWELLGISRADAEGNVEFTDPNVTNQSLRFYRAFER